uniref:Ground-like domain-containing protein n=1 Tax=Strongyloides papillosus TaxID=174720 RepID=A0A0N5BYL3_STREA
MVNIFKYIIFVIIIVINLSNGHKLIKRDDNIKEDNNLDTPKCNSETLKNYMKKNINQSPSESKRAIQRIAEAKIGGTFSVVCSKENFSYLVVTRLYCEVQVDDVTCFAFIHE